MMYINPDECTECGACNDVCPTQAIFFEEELPEKWAFYREVNRRFFPEQNEAKAWEGFQVPA